MVKGVDIQLELALREVRAVSARLPHGRVVLTLAKHQGRVAEWDVEATEETAEDIDRIMRQVPLWYE